MFTFNLSAGAVFCIGIVVGIIIGVAGIVVAAVIVNNRKK